ncbi:FapA family protein [Alteromonas sp. KUL49]|uniref:DUF342 domain-containing protein n=1 Tax=Alteromonas sp. KUL49 TaxID=2480798 RepID=UPI00102F1271|nr:FapA family protein [Alteromonas sp. KUL49]TAP40177.1 DUF342 domain-containing protein [Alteromonas sp. KUL49]GEA11299.1 hypothetical protein KUL49_16740 [Alteromonas sp. KUL49]
MNGVTISLDKSQNNIYLTLDPSEFSKELVFQEVKTLFDQPDTKNLYISNSSLQAAIDAANHNYKTASPNVVKECVGERRNAEVAFKVSEDKMTATLVLTCPYGGKLPSLGAIKLLASKQKIQKGIGTKAIKSVLARAQNASAGEVIERVVAKGLPAKNGRSSRFRPLVPNALERVLKPQTSDGDRVDMRNLGEVICVKVDTPVLRRTEPTPGRSGFDVKGNIVEPISGEWLEFKMAKGTAVSDSDKNLLVSTIAGMPKYQDQTMTIDDTFICNGVNVGTGHITYDGAVLVNGDVTEKMEIKASGDVTINGFVESAYIESQGDIIITEGAMGKVNDADGEFTCKLVAAGSIHVQHGQGLDIHCKGTITVGRQLTYSRLRSGGGVIVGQIDNPQGNLFACDVFTQDKVIAGTLGAVSGSTLKVDFSPGYNQLLERKNAIDELLDQLRKNNLKHKEKIELIKSKKVPQVLQDKVSDALEMFNNESALLAWIEAKALEVKEARDAYQKEIKLIANKRLYPGVSAKLNTRSWRSEREYDRAMIHFDSHKWHYEPIV